MPDKPLSFPFTPFQESDYSSCIDIFTNFLKPFSSIAYKLRARLPREKVILPFPTVISAGLSQITA
jgi:hypothetical protein